MRPVLVTPPASLPVTLADMKAHLRVDHDDEDDLITAYIGAAVAHLDGWSGVLGRCLVEQEWAITMADFPGVRRLSLPFPDVTAVAVQYYTGNVLTTLATADYRLQEDGMGSWLELLANSSWPATDDRADAVTVTFTAAMPAALLPSAVQAIKLLVGHWYRTREAVGVAEVSLPLAFDAVVAPLRRVSM